jgi:hypothetical protein
MSAISPRRPPNGHAENLPTFELDYDLDTPDDPAEITIYSARESELATHWISIDVDHAIDLRDVA